MLVYFLFSCLLSTSRSISTRISNSPNGHYSREKFFHDDAVYIFYDQRVSWDEARVICLSYKAQLATIDGNERAEFIARSIIDSNSPYEDFWIGARTDLAGFWYWTSERSKKFTLNITRNAFPVRYTDSNSNPVDYECLTVSRKYHELPTFVSRRCAHRKPFICQKEVDDTSSERIIEIRRTRVEGEEFTLYSARMTWPEAVVQCRKKGLQIAEVKTVAEARSIAIIMLKARPDSIESAWIGGYIGESSAWTWLPSGSVITRSELWNEDNESFDKCLLLDRHACELPVYIAAQCDRKRDVLCQRTSRKEIDRRPIGVQVEEDLYWVGVYPLEWSKARRSCSRMNATLVTLDSPGKIGHMMSLMLDNAEELRHIWTDGRRRIKEASSNATIVSWEWFWNSTGERVPDDGVGFLRWCTTTERTVETNCLNLDRQNYDTPIVYGLACHRKQAYVCQASKSPIGVTVENAPSAFEPTHSREIKIELSHDIGTSTTRKLSFRSENMPYTSYTLLNSAFTFLKATTEIPKLNNPTTEINTDSRKELPSLTKSIQTGNEKLHDRTDIDTVNDMNTIVGNNTYERNFEGMRNYLGRIMSGQTTEETITEVLDFSSYFNKEPNDGQLRKASTDIPYDKLAVSNVTSNLEDANIDDQLRVGKKNTNFGSNPRIGMSQKSQEKLTRLLISGISIVTVVLRAPHSHSLKIENAKSPTAKAVLLDNSLSSKDMDILPTIIDVI
ncbi:hypothetical protein KM043_008294 [Ampulex compressa]|nr:hypothetical protein KM043_008294 [Ampulex compressa]